MVVRINDAIIDVIDDTDTKRLKSLRISSKKDGVIFVLELPEALCGDFAVRDTVSIVIDSKPIVTGAKTKLYVEGAVYRVRDEKEFEVVGTIGGLRFVLSLSKATPAKKKVFEGSSVYLTIS